MAFDPMLRNQPFDSGLWADAKGQYVTYEDHIAALRACEARVREDERSRVLDAALHALYSMENMGGYPEFDFDHIRDDFRDVIDALKEGS